MWILCIARTNGSMVDFGWPAGFTLMATIYFWYGTGSLLRRYLICGMYIVCGLRFMSGKSTQITWHGSLYTNNSTCHLKHVVGLKFAGWLFGRKHWAREDHRWTNWRNRWRNGFGWFGIKTVELNFLFFYHAQSLTNTFILSVPLHLACARNNGFHASSDAADQLHPFEIAAVVLWVVAFVLENVADLQLSQVS